MQPKDVFERMVLGDDIKDQRDAFRQMVESPEQESSLSFNKNVKEAVQFGGRGAAEGLATQGSLLDLLGIQAPGLLPGEQQRIQAEAQEPADRPSFAALMGDDDILPPTSRIAGRSDVRGISELLGVPGEPETAGGRTAQRLGRAGGASASFGGAGLPLFLGSAIAGAGAEELTGSELAGDIIEIAASFKPHKLLAKRIPKGVGVRAGRAGGKLDLVEVGRKIGMTEAEVATAMQNPTRAKALMKFGSKGSKTEKLANNITAKIGDAYGHIGETAKQLPNIGGRAKQTIIAESENILKNLKSTIKPSKEKEEAIKFISESIENLKKSEANPEKLINWWRDINQSIPWKKLKADKSAAALKKPIIEALESVSPTLANDFEALNLLDSNFRKIVDSLKPGVVDRVIGLGKVAALGGAIFSLNPVSVGSVFLGVAGMKAMAAMATNPRYMNVLKKGMEALADQKTEKVLQIGRKLAEMMLNDFGEEAIDGDLLMQMFNPSSQATKQQGQKE